MATAAEPRADETVRTQGRVLEIAKRLDARQKEYANLERGVARFRLEYDTFRNGALAKMAELRKGIEDDMRELVGESRGALADLRSNVKISGTGISGEETVGEETPKRAGHHNLRDRDEMTRLFGPIVGRTIVGAHTNASIRAQEVGWAVNSPKADTQTARDFYSERNTRGGNFHIRWRALVKYLTERGWTTSEEFTSENHSSTGPKVVTLHKPPKSIDPVVSDEQARESFVAQLELERDAQR